MGNDAVYRAYVLRLRCIVKHEDGSAQWRISVQKAGSQQETPFLSLDELMIYVASQLQVFTAAPPVKTKSDIEPPGQFDII